MRYLLAGVLLVVVGAGACQAEDSIAGTLHLGMDQSEVLKLLGQPTIPCGTLLVYVRTDCVGGQQVMFLDFDPKNRVKEVCTDYRLFADRPPWLDAIHAALSPRHAP